MAVAVRDETAILEQVLVNGDLSKLSGVERFRYYHKVCESLGLNPLTKPFDYITLNGKLTLYVNRSGTDQLREKHDVSIVITDKRLEEGLYIVSARATMNGRTDESTGAVPIDKLTGEARANAIMKAETKAKRRVTLSIVGLGWLDESEVDSIADARRVGVNQDTGEIVEPEHYVQREPIPPPPAAMIEANRASQGLGNSTTRPLSRPAPMPPIGPVRADKLRQLLNAAGATEEEWLQAFDETNLGDKQYEAMTEDEGNNLLHTLERIVGERQTEMAL